LRERLQRITDKLASLREPTIFGASTHQCRLDPPLPDREVDDFEQRHGIELPAEYRAFVTRVGHGGPGQYGGTGPFYGLLPLDCWAEALIEDGRDGILATPFPTRPGVEYGDDWPSEQGLADDDELFPGAIALAHLGCGDMAILVVTGEGRGRVAYTAWASRAPLYTDDVDFVAWYERWLDAALRADTYWF
jgi:hypothetical protein